MEFNFTIRARTLCEVKAGLHFFFYAYVYTLFPDPPISQLLVQFVDQSIKSQGVEETQAHVRKTHSLKLLALQVAAHFKWNLNTLKEK